LAATLRVGMDESPGHVCPGCGKVSAVQVPVCECGHSYYPREAVASKPVAFKPFTLEEKRALRANAGMFLGILSIIGSVAFFYGAIAAFLAIVLSISGLKAEPNKRAVIGLVCGLIGFVLSIVATRFVFSEGWLR
jgi:hypothetical protein